MFGTRYHAALCWPVMVLRLGNALIYKDFIGEVRGFLSMVFLSGDPAEPC